MASTDVKIETQVRRHRPSLMGIAAAVACAGLAVLGLSMFGAGPEVDQAGRGDLTVGVEGQADVSQ